MSQNDNTLSKRLTTFLSGILLFLETKIQFLRLTAAVVLLICCSAEDTAVPGVSGSLYPGSNTFMLQCPGVFGLVQAAKKKFFFIFGKPRIKACPG